MGDCCFELGRNELGVVFWSCVPGQQSLTVWLMLSDGHRGGEATCSSEDDVCQKDTVEDTCRCSSTDDV